MGKIPRVVVTFTTLPDRQEKLLESINSITAQTLQPDAIYLTVPKVCKRLNKPYLAMNEEIIEKCLIVEIDDDYGPITKIYGALISESDPETIIISCDDDTLYERNFIETIVKYGNLYPEACVSGTGAIISRGVHLIGIRTSLKNFLWVNSLISFEVDKIAGRNVDLIFGVSGVLYRRKFFPTKSNLLEELFKISLENDSLFCNDDVVISAYLSKVNVVKKVFVDIPPVSTLPSDKNSLSRNFFTMMIRMQEAINHCKSLGLYQEMENIPISETVAGRLVILFFIILTIIVLCLFFLKWTDRF